MPEGDSDYPIRWPLIKSAFSRRMEKTEFIRASRVNKRERGLWQRRYWEHQMRLDSIYNLALAIVLLEFGASADIEHAFIHTAAVVSALFAIMQSFLSTMRHGQESLVVLEAKLLNDDKKSRESLANSHSESETA